MSADPKPASTGRSPLPGRIGPAAWGAAAGIALGGVAALQAGWQACAAAALATAALGTALGWRRRRAAAVAGPHAASSPRAEAHARLADSIVPVWKRNVEAARGHSERSATSLLTDFASVSGHLEQALSTEADGPQLDLGSFDNVLEQHRAELETLLASTRQVARVKDELLGGQAGIVTGLAELNQLAREVQTIGLATQLLALNASVEASRADRAGGGFAVVAQEVRELAHQSSEAGLQIGKRVDALHQSAVALQRQSRRLDTDDDELLLQAEAAARTVLVGLLGGLADFSRSSRGLREAGRQVQADLERIYMGLQAQDRLSQMLGSVTEDMTRFEAVMQGIEDPAAAAPTEWLARLEAAYTMEEMRTAHHGTVAVERQAAVEFF